MLGLDFSRLKSEWFPSPQRDLVAGTTVALALIPEAIAFSIIAGVDPKVGLYASFIIAVMTAFFGGRPGMISAATGAMALLMGSLVASHGIEYLLAASVLTGVLQVAFRLGKLSRYMKFVPRPVMTGFVNALAILIFMAQLPQFAGANWQMYAMVVGGSRDHLRPAACHEAGAVGSRRHRGAERRVHLHGGRRPHSGRHGGAADSAARLPSARRAFHLRDAADHLSLRRRTGDGGAH